MKIIPLSEGSFTVGQTKKFVPFRVAEDDLQQRSKGSLLVEIQPFVVIASKDILLLDTGLGFADEHNQLQIHKNLALHGIDSSDVTKVLLSHLHKDHSGGIAMPGKKELSFQNATYYINQHEWNFAFEKGFPSYVTEDFICLNNSNQLQFIEGNGTIDEYIHYEMTGAHSPYHQVFLIDDNVEKIFFGGDVAPQLQQMKNRFKAKYDYDGAKAMELRMKWWQLGEKEKWTFLFITI
ncbi:MBL fold metallo-hydrolase [Ginsengibacter hankyongi]|uniref:MBL fold metallo-hydrolase n=1 Tax=Ginsengibacter hankyongi TaxID=2607284 RepID=A0A5J5IM51_9BACT|nr:MBL fold metallo-hydrolase [Ginsengibacter hankyongi]KAA9041811.1 MBL fold metallo-hydrolase [Ginsengibacter hankyongi]